MARAKDTQRSKLYKAERAVFSYYPGRVLSGAPGATPGAMKLGNRVSVEEMEALHWKIGMSKRLNTKYRGGRPGRSVTVKIDSRRKRGGAASYGGYVKYGPPAMLDWIVCHEMAHELNDIFSTNENPYERASHGWRFAAIYLDVVKFIMGKEAHDQLKASFKAHGVKFTKPVKRAVKAATPAQIAARAAFAEKARARAEAKRIAKCEAWIEAQTTFYLNDAKRWNVPMTEAEARAKAWKYVPSNLL